MKRKIQSLVIVGLLLVIAIACQHDNDLDTQIASKTEIHEKVSINEAKALFEEEEAIKVKQKLANKNGYFLKINPDWNSFQQDRDFGNGNYSKVTTTLFGTDIKGEILFIKQNDSIKQFLFMTRTDSINTQGEVLDAQLYFFETNGKLVEAYKIENQRITKRLKIHKQRSLTARRGGEGCGFLQKVDVLGWDVGCTSGNNDNWGSGKKNTWGPNPFTFDGVNELYGVTVEHWHSNNNYTFSHQMNFRNFRLMGNNAGSSFSEAGAHIIRTNPPKPREIIDNLTNPCAKDLLKQLPNLKNDIAKLLKETFGGDSKYDITFTEDENLRKKGIDGQANASNATKISEDEIIFRSNIYLNPDILENATQEYILVTMYHEVIHAFLNYEETRLRGKILPNGKFDNSEFEHKYPDVKIVELEYGNKNKVKKYQLLQEQGHNRFAPFIEKLAQSIISFNPKIPLKTARAMAKMGIVDEKSMSNEEKLLNQGQRNGTDTKGTKCN